MSEMRSDRGAARRQARQAERQQQANARPQPQRAPAAATRRGGPVAFVSESLAELKKVEWPGQNQVVQGTVVVLIACIVVGTYLYVNDLVWKHVVTNFLLGQ
jgi:preprotein translocase SecE subunit